MKWALFAAVVLLVGKRLKTEWGSIEWDAIRFSWAYLAAGFLAALTGNALSLFSYRAVLDIFDSAPGHLETAPIAWIPPIGKYLPGKIASLAGAVWLLQRSGVPGTVSAGTVFLMNALRVQLGMLLAVPLTLWEPVRSVLPHAWMWCGGLLILGGVSLHPRIFSTVADFLSRKLRHQSFPGISKVWDYTEAIAVMSVQWILVGLSLWLLTRSMGVASVGQIPLFVAASALATNLGFLAFFAPAGLGVWEGILILILPRIVASGPAAVAIIAMRLAYILADITLATVGFMIMRRQTNRAVRDKNVGTDDDGP